MTEMTKERFDEANEKMEREMFMEHCGESGIPATKKNWIEFKEHREMILSKWDKLTEERMKQNGAPTGWEKERV